MQRLTFVDFFPHRHFLAWLRYSKRCSTSHNNPQRLPNQHSVEIVANKSFPHKQRTLGRCIAKMFLYLTIFFFLFFFFSARLCFEEYIYRTLEIPACLFVMNGGWQTLVTAAKWASREFPVVVFEGSGRMADCIASTLNSVFFPPELSTFLKKRECPKFSFHK